jgi:tRNA threonylcarbamoyladenosine biosynthesis protein TsaE
MSASDLTLLMTSEEETARLAAGLAPLLRPGDTILLQGGLGGGKTHFARSLVQERLRRAGRMEDVPSPTFTLVQVYDDGDGEIWHCDLYRLGGPEEVAELGLEEAFETAICLVEWPERLEGMTPPDALLARFEMQPDPGARRLRLSWSAPRWAGLLDAARERADG